MGVLFLCKNCSHIFTGYKKIGKKNYLHLILNLFSIFSTSEGKIFLVQLDLDMIALIWFSLSWPLGSRWMIFSLTTSQPGPGTARKKLMSLRHPSGHFTLHKVFSPLAHLGFRVWGTQGSRGWVGRVMLVLRTFPELVGRSVQNLVKIGPMVWAWKGYIGK